MYNEHNLFANSFFSKEKANKKQLKVTILSKKYKSSLHKQQNRRKNQPNEDL